MPHIFARCDLRWAGNRLFQHGGKTLLAEVVSDGRLPPAVTIHSGGGRRRAISELAP
jgi:hypothetical protein